MEAKSRLYRVQKKTCDNLRLIHKLPHFPHVHYHIRCTIHREEYRVWLSDEKLLLKVAIRCTRCFSQHLILQRTKERHQTVAMFSLPRSNERRCFLHRRWTSKIVERTTCNVLPRYNRSTSNLRYYEMEQKKSCLLRKIRIASDVESSDLAACNACLSFPRYLQAVHRARAKLWNDFFSIYSFTFIAF